MKSFYIEILGCAKNVADSDQLSALLIDSGFIPLTRPDEAEIIIVNTCGFLEAAVKDSIDSILELSKYKNEKCKKLVVIGCMVERYKNKLIDEIPEVDLFFGTNYYDSVVGHILNTDKGHFFNTTTKILAPTSHKLSGNSYAYIKVAEGCDNRCSYCIIPKLRGRFRSKRLEDILSEARTLAGLGVKEIILVAQDVSRYGLDISSSIEELLLELNEVDGIEWIRLQYLYPDILTENFFRTIIRCNKVVPYIDVPIQHISDIILNRMNRNTNSVKIRKFLNMAREIIPDISIRTTLITGFPGERETDFNLMLDFLYEQRFDRVGVFTYSDEEMAPSYNLDSKVDDYIKYRRQEKLLMAQSIISMENQSKKLNRVLDVIVDKHTEFGYVGRTKWDSPEVDGVVRVNGERLPIGSINKVIITKTFEHDLEGENYEFGK